MKVKISEIQVPQPYRFDTGNMEELKTTIQKYGMIHPIVVKDLGENISPRYELIAGYRRFKAIESLGWTEIPITLLQPKDTLEQFDISMEENMKRKDLNPLEISHLLIQRKRLWEQIHGPIIQGKPSAYVEVSDGSCTNVQNFYEETGKVFKKYPRDIYNFLQLQGLDEDLKAKVESGELHYRKAITEQSNRKPPVELKPKKHKRKRFHVPQAPRDILTLKHDVQLAVWKLAELYRALQVLEGQEYEFDTLAEERMVEMVGMCASLQEWIGHFNDKLQNTLLQKSGLSDVATPNPAFPLN